MNWLGIDVGGANLKLANGNGYAKSSPFALWKQPERLSAELRRLFAEAPASDALAVTMTGELADCFENKTAGVRFILAAVTEAADQRQVRVYQTNGELVTVETALQTPLLSAAANWHALAKFAGRFVGNAPSLLIDMGSTTCDLIPLLNGAPSNSRASDTERLLSGQLVYTGVQRSPVCGLVSEIPYRNQRCSVAQELFATTLDAYLILGAIAEDPGNTATVDGRPATRVAAVARLGRMICADEQQFNDRDALAMAEAIAAAQQQCVVAALERVIASMPDVPQKAVISGQGEFLARRVAGQVLHSAEIISLSEALGAVVSRCAAAHALAVLAREACELKPL